MSGAHHSRHDDAPGRIEREITGGIAWLRIHNPRRYNAMSLAMWRELARQVQALDTDPDVRVVVVTGTGDRAFVSGADISEFATLRDSTEQVDAYGLAVHEAQSALAASNKPTVALINGICMGGGIGIALSCDLRFCVSSARFRMPAARLGLGYDLDGLRRAVQVMGYASTTDIFFSARTFDGMEAQRLGLVNRCFPAEHFALQAQAVLAEMATNAPLTLTAAKRALRHILDATQVTPDEVEVAIRACFESEDYREGQRAFADKRDPVFTGR